MIHFSLHVVLKVIRGISEHDLKR